MNESPDKGILADEMRGARYKYHYAICDVKKHEKC